MIQDLIQDSGRQWKSKSLHDLLKILPHLPSNLDRWIPQEVGRMECRHECDVLFPVAVLRPLPAKTGDPKVRTEQQLRGRSTKGHDDVWLDDSYLSREEHAAKVEIR